MEPHSNVYARIGASPTSGVGVFAIRDIPADTNIFDERPSWLVWIDEADIMGLPEEIQKLYVDFGVPIDGKIGCPSSFNEITPSWYVNHSKDNPNLYADEGFVFKALRDIKAGEELLVDYTSYCEHDPMVMQ